MKVLIWLALMGLSLILFAGCQNISDTQAAKTKVLRHVVLFDFKDDATAEQIKAIEEAFAALPSKISEIKDFEWGTDVSVENLAQGYTHCFFVTFGSEKDRAVYLPHPEHKRFVELVGPIVEKVLVVDYWTR